VIQPVEAALAHLPRLEIADNAVDAICHGAPLAAPGLLSLETGISRGDDVVLFTLKGEAVAIARAELSSEEMLASSSGIVAATERVIMEPGTYPKAWKLAERDGSTEIRAEAKR
jgi:H/ACA ribonucleoprotein complex subunit 4